MGCIGKYVPGWHGDDPFTREAPRERKRDLSGTKMLYEGLSVLERTGEDA